MTRKSWRLKYGITILIVILLLVLFRLPAVNSKVKNFFYVLSSPIQKSLWQLSTDVSRFLETIENIKKLSKENEELKNKNQELLSRIAIFEEKEKENEKLRTALGIEPEEKFKLILAEVISKDISEDTILINKGSKDGLSLAMPVLTESRALLGRVSEVYDRFSKVILISNKNSSFDAKIQGKDIFGVIKGKGNFSLLMDLIPKGKEFKEGDTVVTAVLGGAFPEGILVGEISRIRKNDADPFDQAEIKPAFDIKKIEDLFIIVDY